ncbi:ATP-binding cassette sub-family C member 4-like isoform X2 [Cylas formicarius]|nr:ATP-binding cassette sub-family C member 4-like isoform X2 [Cylas formicarius]
MLQPIVLAEYIKYFDNTSSRSAQEGWLLGSGVIGLAFINVIVWHFTLLEMSRIGMRVRIACSSLIYRKLLRLNHISLEKTASGQVVNLLSNDVVRFDIAAPFLHYIWMMPLIALVSLYIMYSYIGLAALPTFGGMTLQAVVMQGYLSKLQGYFRGKIALLTDGRVKLMSEITAGIQVIKMYAWEQPFEKMVEVARKKEVDAITKTSYIKGFSAALNVFIERAALYVAVVSYVLLGNEITGDVVFSMAQLLNSVQLFMSIFFPMALSTYEEAKVSVKRLEDFLVMEENTAVDYCVNEDTTSGDLRLVKARASWLANPIVDTLRDINLEIQSGTLCCVIGEVGSGKSSLLQVVLRELPLTAGKLETTGRVSFAAQDPWLFAASIRQNILFGMPYDRNRYKDVVRVCALERDFEQLPHGDRTFVGERGMALSGGQKARVALARAVYRDVDIYLLDDPLSAVDAHVAKHLFEQCIQGYLQNKTRILVTHQVQFLKGAEVIVLMHNGKITKKGAINDLSQEDLSLLSKEVEQTHQVKKEIKQDPTPHIIKRERLQSVSSVISMVGNDDSEEAEELLAKGSISTSTYVEYYKSGASWLMLVLLLLILIIAQTTCNASDMWVTYWTNQKQMQYNQEFSSATSNNISAKNINATDKSELNLILDSNATDVPLLTTNFSTNITEQFKEFENETLFSTDNEYIYVYTGLIIAAIILTSARSTLFFKICMNASKVMHNKMFHCVLKAPMSFFDSNPSGRILNRFSKDMGAVDEVLPKCTLDAIQIFLVAAGILGMVFIINPWMIIPALVLCILFVYIRAVYLTSAQDIKRLEGMTKGPVFSHLSASLNGLSSIRAFQAQRLVTSEFDALQDQHTATWFMFITSSETLGFYLDVISTIFLCLVTFQFMILHNADTHSGSVGLVIAHSLILTGMLQYGVRQSAEVSSNMTSVERVLQYTHLEEEGPWEPLPANRAPTGWPDKGRIKFKHAYMRYTPDSVPVLRDLNLRLRPGEKVGVVGRTGAGKSSLIAALFRLASVDGLIELDKQDTAVVGLRTLRSSISIIPQHPTLFSASLRYNLDPFGRNQDEDLWRALERVELRQAANNLEQLVSEGGANFSAGQRQLICLARAIVRKNKVLVMDEATANVDPHTDSLIQRTIRDCFQDCTVITIAHRLNTIMDSDRVLVMDAGQAVEFAPPHELMQIPNGYFAKMVEETGPSMESRLKAIAQETYEKRGLYNYTNNDNDSSD